jgi:hypothetical protein
MSNEHEQPRHGVAHLDDWQGLRLYDERFKNE